jgi:hypothetical protein
MRTEWNGIHQLLSTWHKILSLKVSYVNYLQIKCLKMWCLSPGQTRKHCCGNICDSRCFLECFHVCLPVETLLRKQNLKQKCFQPTQFRNIWCFPIFLTNISLCFPNLGNMAKHWTVGNNVSAKMFPQECFLVCPGLNSRKCNMILSNSTARWSCKLLNLWEMMHIMWKFRNCTQVLALHMYSNRHFCAFKLYNEYFRLLTFLIISATCLDHFKSLLIVSPKTLAWSTSSRIPELRTTLGKGLLTVVNWNSSSLHFGTW